MSAEVAAHPETVHLELDGFEGPLDLLLDLARRQRVDLARISIGMLVDQYVLAVTNAARADINRTADWLVMAAWLTWLKSRLLVAAGPEEAREAEQAHQILVQRLAELDRVREVADWLNCQPQLGWDMFERGDVEQTRTVAREGSYMMLLEACVGLFRNASRQSTSVYQPRRRPEWTPQQAAGRIMALLTKDPRGGDLLGFVPNLPDEMPNREHNLRTAITSTLVASLELARDTRVSLDQKKPFGPILLRATYAAATKRETDDIDTPPAS